MFRLLRAQAPYIFMLLSAWLFCATAQAQYAQPVKMPIGPPKAPPPAIAEPSGKILLDAKFMERDNEKDITILRDNVQIIMDQNYISCNEAVIQWSKNQVVAVGNVLMKTPRATIQADKIVYDLKTHKGQIYNGVILSGQILVQGEYLEKIGEDTYKGENTYLTSCTTCPASWSFTADKFEAEIEGYAYISNAWLHFLEVPAIYMPYLILPLKNDRQTGLLPPTIGFAKKGGVNFEVPFFWAINRSQDLTLTAKYYGQRGLQFLSNYRFRLSQKSGGDHHFGIMKDRRYLDRPTRWYTKYNHFLDLPHGFVQRTSLLLASDNEYSIDFQQQFNYRGEPALDNRVSLTKNFPEYHLSVDSSYYLSLIERNVDEARQTSVHRVPEVRFSITDRKLSKHSPIFFKFDSQYVNFARQGLGYDSPYTPAGADPSTVWYRPESPTGIFDPTRDIVRTGQRLDLLPYFYAPLRFWDNKINVTPFAGYRYTQYVLGALNEAQGYNFDPHRGYFLTGVNAKTEISRVFTAGKTKFRHSVTPEVSYQTIQALNQTKTPFFGNQAQIPYFSQTQPLQDLDLQPTGRGLQFDYEDRIVGRRLVNFSLLNKLILKSNSTIGSRYDQAVLLGLSQAYDMEEANKENGLPWQDIRGTLNVRWGRIDSLTEAFHFPYHKQTNLNSRLRLYVYNYNFLEVIYSNYRNIPVKPADIKLNTERQNMWFSTGINSTYATLMVTAEYNINDEKFKRWALVGQVIPPGSCWIIETNLFQTLDAQNVGGTVNVTFKFGN